MTRAILRAELRNALVPLVMLPDEIEPTSQPGRYVVSPEAIADARASALRVQRLLSDLDELEVSR